MYPLIQVLTFFSWLDLHVDFLAAEISLDTVHEEAGRWEIMMLSGMACSPAFGLSRGRVGERDIHP